MRKNLVLSFAVLSLVVASCGEKPPRRRRQARSRSKGKSASVRPAPAKTKATPAQAEAKPAEVKTAPAKAEGGRRKAEGRIHPSSFRIHPSAAEAEEGLPAGWQLGVQAYTFRKFTFFQTVEKSAAPVRQAQGDAVSSSCRTAALGLKSIEMYPGQKIGGQLSGSTGHGMDTETRTRVAEKLRKHGIRVAAYGVVNAGGEDGWRKVFEFAKAMGIGTIVTEPSENQLDTVEKLCDEYGVTAAIHNHPKPSRYWRPEAVLAACEGRSSRLGACADTGHWARSGLDPLECLRKLKGRVISLHLKDVKDGRDVPFGKGAIRMPKLLAELKRQRFKGPISIEYESSPENPYLPVKQCVRYVRLNAGLSVEDLAAGKARAGHMSDEVAEVWKRLDPHDDGLWVGTPGVAKDDDTSAYYDTTDDGKGTITACGDGFPKEHYPNAFDNSSETKWCILLPKIWVQYRYPDGRKERIIAYSIRSANDTPARDPADWKLLGSNDGQDWEAVDERKGERFKARFHKRLFEVKKPGSYNIYKLDVTKNAGTDRSQLSEIELLIDKALTGEQEGRLLRTPRPSAAPKKHPNARRWADVFKTDLSNAICPAGVWRFENGVLTASKDEAVWTKKVYDNFILDLEFKNSRGTNSGVMVYCSDIGNWIPNSIEIQIADTFGQGKPGMGDCGAIFGHLAPSKNMVKEPGEWNRCTVTCRDNMIHVMLNGEMVAEMDMKRWTSAKKNPDGSDIPPWLSRPVASLRTRGYIGFQGKHGGAPIYFREIKIREIR